MRSKIVGHHKQRSLLEKAIDLNNIPHALLFEGPASLGKKTLALYLAQKIACEATNPCGVCQGCLSVEKGSCPDVSLISPLKKQIQISQIREISKKLSFKSYALPYKIVIVDDAHLMNRDAQNSFLKILEEPKGDSIIILVSEYPEYLFATVRSRTQRIRFFPVDRKEIEKYLKDLGCEGKKAEEIISFSFGRPGLALNFLNDPERIGFRKEKVKELLQIISPASPFHMRFKYAKTLSENAEEAVEILKIWLSYFRVLFLEKVKGENVRYDTLKIKKNIENIEKSIQFITGTNANSKMVLEVLMMDL